MLVDPVEPELHPTERPKLRPPADPLHPFQQETTSGKVYPGERLVQSTGPSPHPYAVPSTAVPPWEQRNIPSGTAHLLAPASPPRPRDVLAELHKQKLLIQHKEAVVNEELDIRDQEMRQGREIVAMRLQAVESEFAASVAEKNATIARLQGESEMWRRRAEDCARQLQGVLKAMEKLEAEKESKERNLGNHLDLANEELQRLKHQAYLLTDANAQIRQQFQIAQDQRADAQIGETASTKHIQQLTIQNGALKGEVAALQRRLEHVNASMNQLRTERDRLNRTVEALELQLSSSEKHQGTAAADLRIAALEEELLRVQRNNSRIMSLLSEISSNTDSTTKEATMKAARLIKVVNGAFSFLGDPKQLSGLRRSVPKYRSDIPAYVAMAEQSRLSARGEEARTVVDEFNGTQNSLLRLGLTSERSKLSAPIAKISFDGDALLEEESWIPSIAYEILTEFKLKYFSNERASELSDVFLLLLKDLWVALKRTSLGAAPLMMEASTSHLHERHQPKVQICPKCAALHTNSTPKVEDSHALTVGGARNQPGVLEREATVAHPMPFDAFSNIQSDGLVLDASRSIHCLKRLLVAADSMVFPVGEMSTMKFKLQLKMCLQTIHALLARSERLGASYQQHSGKQQQQSQHEGLNRRQRPSAAAMASIAAPLECRLAELLRSVDDIVDRLARLVGSVADGTALHQRPPNPATVLSLLENATAHQDALKLIRRELFSFREDVLYLLRTPTNTS